MYILPLCLLVRLWGTIREGLSGTNVGSMNLEVV